MIDATNNLRRIKRRRIFTCIVCVDRHAVEVMACLDELRQAVDSFLVDLFVVLRLLELFLIDCNRRRVLK